MSFSRQGKPFILACLMTLISIYFLIKKRYLIAGFVIGLGMYSQAAFWGVFLLSFYNLKTFTTALFIILPLFYILFEHAFIFSSTSYLGEKFIGSIQLGFSKYLKGIINNFIKNISALYIKGTNDIISAPPNQPFLDIVTGFFLIIGCYFLIKNYKKNKNKQAIQKLIIAFFVIQIPSILDVKNPLSTPNMGRTIGLMPILYIISAYGIYHFLLHFDEFLKKLFLIFISFLIFGFNFYQYFYIYPESLPNNNISFSKLIAKEIEKYDEHIPIYMVDCCWSFGRPEPMAVEFELKIKNRVRYLSKNDFLNTCSEINGKFLVISDPAENLINKCLIANTNYVLTKANKNVANFVFFRN